MQKEFINIAAHELRTPIQPILGATELIELELKDKDKVEITKPEVELIVRNAKRLQRLSSDLLEASRIESESLVLYKELFDLNGTILAAVEDAKSSVPSSKRERIEWIIKQPDDAKIMVEADKSRLMEVVSNLLRNAIKFTDEGSITVTVEGKSNDGMVEVRIVDTGAGIHNDVLPKLFTKFVTRSDQGTGLGLFIAKNIIDAHSGSITAENNPSGRGATFTFTLPITNQLQQETNKQAT
jgi:signal transduction histidine kinase